MYNLSDHRISGDAPIYENNDQFTAELHICGDLLDFGQGMQFYKDGSIIWVDRIKWEYMSVLDFANAGIDLFGYGGKISLWYRVPGTEQSNGIENGLRRFATDADYNEFIRLLPLNRVGVIFYDGVIEDFNKATKARTNTLPELFGVCGDQVVLEATPLDVVAPPVHEHCDAGEDEENHRRPAAKDDVINDPDYEVSDDELSDDPLSSDYDTDELSDDPLSSESVTGLGKGLMAGELGDDPLSSDYDTDELLSLDSESSHSEDDGDDCQKKKKTRFHQFRMETDLRSAKFTMGMLFNNSTEFKEAVKEAFINSGRSCRFDINDWYKVRAVCTKWPKCKYNIYASVIGKPDRSKTTFQVKTMCLTHSCGREDKVKQVSSNWLAARFQNDFRMNPSMKISNFKEIVREKYMVEVSDGQAYRAKRLANRKLEGNHDDQYAKLRDYLQEIVTTNPGTTVQLKAPIEGTTHIFERLYICYDALKKGFLNGCRPLIGLDGCHIKSPHPGQLLSAVGIDGNNGMFPIAFAIVELETRDSWTWFLELLIDDLQIADSPAWVFISDKQKGLINAIETLLPNAQHRHCVRHFYNNFKIKHGGLELKQRLWACARATTIGKFKGEMDKLKALDSNAHEWLLKHSPKHWSRSHFDAEPKCDILLNNHSESFNAAILEARNKPIIGMLERLRMYLMLRMTKQREASKRWFGDIGPRISKILEANKGYGSGCIASLCGEGSYQVRTPEFSLYAVDLNKMTCSCRRFQLTGIPCGHAIACIYAKEKDPVDYICDWYKKPAWARTYAPFLRPISDEQDWFSTGLPPVLPPRYKKQRGRPKKVRAREPGEIEEAAAAAKKKLANDPKLDRSHYVRISCSVCKKGGHNKTTCKKRNQQSSQQTTQSAPQAD